MTVAHIPEPSREALRQAWGRLKLQDAWRQTRHAAPYEEYRLRPVDFMREVLGWEPWSLQRDITEALWLDRMVSVATCNAAGKSTLAAAIIATFMSVHRNARVIVYADVAPQVRIVWRKLRAAHEGAKRKLPGEVLSERWDLGPEWYAIGSSTDEETRLQGYHSLNSRTDGQGPQPHDDGALLAVTDEAGGAKAHAFNAMRGWMTDANCFWLVIGNPNDPDGEFARTFTAGSWRRFQVSAFDVPEHIIKREWIEEQRELWGEDSPQYQVRVLGQFPKVGGDYLVFPTSYFEGAADTHPREGGKHLGVDVSRGASDRNTMVLTVNGRVVDAIAWHSPDLMQTALRIAEFCEERSVPWENVHVDVIGLGAGVVDRLREAGYNVDGVDFGAQPMQDWAWLMGSDARMLNRRAELYWAARMALAQDHAAVPREFRHTIWREAGLVQYEQTDKGVTKIEPKERIRARLHGESPDFCDAWVLSFARATTSARRIYVI